MKQEIELSDDVLCRDAERYRWLRNQVQAGSLTVHSQVMGHLMLWADSQSFEENIDKAIRVQNTLRNWQESC